MNPSLEAEIENLTRWSSHIASGDLSFPTGADAALRVMRAVDNPDAGVEVLARIVVAEPLLAAKVIQIANSVAFNNGNQPIHDVRQAVMRIGSSPVRSLALALTLDQMRQSHRLGAWRQLANQWWERSVHVAALSYVVARQMTRIAPDEAMAAGIVHDLGRFYLLGLATDQPALLGAPDVLCQTIDALAPQVTLRVLEAMGLPAAVIAAVAASSEFAGRGERAVPETLADILFLARWLAPPIAATDPELLRQKRETEGAALGLDHAQISAMLKASGDEIYTIILALEA